MSDGTIGPGAFALKNRPAPIATRREASRPPGGRAEACLSTGFVISGKFAVLWTIGRRIVYNINKQKHSLAVNTIARQENGFENLALRRACCDIYYFDEGTVRIVPFLKFDPHDVLSA